MVGRLCACVHACVCVCVCVCETGDNVLVDLVKSGGDGWLMCVVCDRGLGVYVCIWCGCFCVWVCVCVDMVGVGVDADFRVSYFPPRVIS